MSDSPKSERFEQTRFSTPVSDLDDHRLQPSSMPRADNVSSHGRPGTRRNTVNSVSNEQPDLLQVNEALHLQGMTARDFEQAIVEDDEQVPVTADAGHRRSSAASPVLERGNTFRRPRRPEEKPSRSRNSAASSQSTSPPNSVDAFADARRRQRAGTVNSVAPSHLEIALKRTISGGTHRRRPTFSDNRTNDAADDSNSAHSSAEEDVCFPQDEEPGKTYRIDFEDLEEFVAETRGRPLRHTRSHDSQSSRVSKPRVFNDLRPKSATPTLPKIKTYAPSLNGDICNAAAVCKDEIDNEKLECLERTETAVEEAVKRWTFFSSELEDAIFASDLGGLLMPGESFRDLFEPTPSAEGEGVWWLDMLAPTKDEVEVICKAFGIHPMTREDILTQETREKVELFQQYYFMCFRSFNQVDKDASADAGTLAHHRPTDPENPTESRREPFLEPVNVYAVVFREGILTFTFSPNPHAANVRRRIGRLRNHIHMSADWICYAWIDDIVDLFGPVIRDVEHQTDAIEDQVFTARAEDSRLILRAIADCRRKVMSLLRLLGGKADVIKGFAKRCNENYSVAPRGDVGIYLSDVQDHVVTMMSNLAHFEKMLSRSHSNYLAQISLDNIAQGNAVNVTLGKVTLVATILVPLNLITGLFGMNVNVPGKETGGLGWFFGIVGCICGFVVFCFLLAKRLRWM